MNKAAFHELCANDDMRPVMSYVFVTRDKVVATDANVMGWQDTTDVFNNYEFERHIPEEGMLIHSEDWKKLHKADGLQWKTEGKVIKILHKKKRDELIEVEMQSDVGKFPNWEAVVPTDEPIGIPAIGINIDFLSRIGKFYKPLDSTTSIKMVFSHPNKAIRVSLAKPTDKSFESAKALIMPVMIDN